MRGTVTWAGAMVIAASLSAIGCVESPAVVCADGQLCPPGTVCDPNQRGCLLPGQVEECDGADDGSECSFQGVPDGVCFDGVCFPAGCGNGELEDGEVCDDNNRLHGDGCSADCRSTEECGNNIVDVTRGESCDDGKHCQPVCGDGTVCASDNDCEGIGDGSCTGAPCSVDGDCAGIGDEACQPRDGDDCQASCVTPACGDGVVDVRFLEACDDGDENADTPNAACRTNCQPQRCGDGIPDLGLTEECDDSNALPGDGCSDACKLEVCGNGILDVTFEGGSLVDAEECDDGPVGFGLNHDGCAVCTAETLRWQEDDIRQRPPFRHGAAMAYDPSRERVVMFGGTLLVPPGDVAASYLDTWEWDGVSWSEVTPLGLSPPSRERGAMAYDSRRRRMVLVGGADAAGSPLADTWEWDGRAWHDVTPTGPVPSFGPIAYDPTRGVTVRPDGNIVWEWDGASWTQVVPATQAPAATAGTIAAFDPIAGVVALYRRSEGVWEWDGVDWSLTVPGSTPTLTHMVFDTVRQQLVGIDASFSIFGWDGATWGSLGGSAAEPLPRDLTNLVFDIRHGNAVLFGGLDICGGPGSDRPVCGFNDTWTLDASGWTEVSVDASPSLRAGHAMGFSRFDGGLMFGGEDASGLLADTWTWDGTSWTQVEAVGGTFPDFELPGPRRDHTLLARGGQWLMFGGRVGQAHYGDTWEWQDVGLEWRQLTTGDSPSPRAGHAMSIDGPLNSRFVLFGGAAGTVEFNDTWTFGAIWREVFPLTSPPARSGHAMCSVDGDVTLMFGGESNGDLLSDTWLFVNDGGSVDTFEWQEQFPTTTPPPRSGHTLVCDGFFGNPILFGGKDRFGEALGDAWEWTGTNWSEITGALPPPRFDHSMTYDEDRDVFILFGGADVTLGADDDITVFRQDVWEFSQFPVAATDVTPGADRPGGRQQHALAYDPSSGRVLLVGGVEAAALQETWTWDGRRWVQLFAGAGPLLGGMAYDPVRGVLVHYRQGATQHEWNGSSWNEVTPPATPSTAGAMATHLANDTIIFVAQGNGDTWEWNGTTWTLVASGAGSVPPIGIKLLAHDAKREVTVAFTITQRQTWEWNGTSWTQLAPLANPPSGLHTMTYDAVAQRVVLVAANGDAWTWDGTTWTQQPLAETPGLRNFSAATYDAAREEIVLFGGENGAFLNDTWTLKLSADGVDEACETGLDGDGDGLAGCLDPDCWAYCTPDCPPHSTPGWPGDCDISTNACGDGSCNAGLENPRLCPADCAGATCGDNHCHPEENTATCPGDCVP